MYERGEGDESLRGMEIVGTFVLIGVKVGLRFRRAARSGMSRAVITGTDEERGGPMPVRARTTSRKVRDVAFS